MSASCGRVSHATPAAHSPLLRHLCWLSSSACYCVQGIVPVFSCLSAIVRYCVSIARYRVPYGLSDPGREPLFVARRTNLTLILSATLFSLPWERYPLLPCCYLQSAASILHLNFRNNAKGIDSRKARKKHSNDRQIGLNISQYATVQR